MLRSWVSTIKVPDTQVYLNKDPDYKRDSSSPSLSRNASFNVFNKDGGQCEDKGKKPLGNN